MIRNKAAAGIMSAVMLCTATVPSFFSNVELNAGAASDAKVLFSYDFEDGDVSAFTGRGGVETIEATNEKSHSGDKSMCISGREKNWNGPQFSLSDHCEAGVEYTISAWVCPEWYNTINLSMEYTDAGGEIHYFNFASKGGDGWMEFSDVKVSFSDDVTNVYVYFEGSDTANIYVDDFILKSAPVYDIQDDIVSLKDTYADYFKIGCAATASELAPTTTKDLIKKHYNSFTAGNEMKPDSLLDKNATLASGSNTNPQVTLNNARSQLNFCRDNNISMRGHVLVWHQQTPDWFFRENYEEGGEWASKEVMIERLENYIKNVFAALKEEYPTVDFYAYDVVNECFLDDGSARQGGANNGSQQTSPWVQIFGDNSFIEYAFRFAREYAPEGCKLYYNDFNEYIDGKTNAIYNMAMDFKEKGIIDGIGMQSHLDTGFPTVSQYEKALSKFASTGLDVQVTELDITTNDKSETGLEKQAEIYSGILDACVKYSDSISAVVFWGITDETSWRSDRLPLLFNGDYTAKPSFYAIVDGISSVGTTTTTTITTKDIEIAVPALVGVTPETAVLTVGETLKPEFKWMSGTSSDSLYYGYTYLSSDDSIATVDSKGHIHAAAPGKAVISYYVPSGPKFNIEVTVMEAETTTTSATTTNTTLTETTTVITTTAANIDRITPESATLTVGEILSPMFWSSSMGVYDYYYGDRTSSDNSVATVDSEGHIHAVAPGKAIITYTTLYNNKISIEIQVVEAETTTTTTTGTIITTETTTVPIHAGDKIGDINLDGKISMIDAVYMNKYIAKIIKLNAQQFANADCLLDGEVNLSDASALMNFLSEKVDSLPVVKN